MRRDSKLCYVDGMSEQQLELLFRAVRALPTEDQEELVEIVRDIQPRRTGTYRATPSGLAAIDNAEGSGVADQSQVDAAFRAFRTE